MAVRPVELAIKSRTRLSYFRNMVCMSVLDFGVTIKVASDIRVVPASSDFLST